MTADLDRMRRFFAEEIEAVANLKSSALVDALAIVPRERFLPPGPWTILSVADYQPTAGAMAAARPAYRTTVDADPRRVYHNVAVAIDPARQLFNGQPATLAVWIDGLGLTPGSRVLHIGCGLGYYTAVMAHCVGPTGRVLALEVDEQLASDARRALSSIEWVEVRAGDGAETGPETFDAILVNAGVSHPLDAWLRALAPGGRLLLPLTIAMGPLGKGFMLMLTKDDRGFDARRLQMVMIYSAIGIRDEETARRLGAAFTRTPFPALKRLRVDAHEESSACWLHAPTFCLQV